ncbi:MAG: 30S ribosomal protein S1 [Verrucomicrobia bacterium]|nr:30S ribosomal protein S1 [Verrucomicrobiota bacterium]
MPTDKEKSKSSHPMHELFAKTAQAIAEGSVVKGRIIEIRPDAAVVDIGYKSEGNIPMHEFPDPAAIHVGDEIEVLLEKLENEEGTVVLSFEKAEAKKNWDRIIVICNEGGTVSGKVKAVVKGGMIVNIGVEAFLPASQVDVIPPRNIQEFVGQTIECKVVKINQDRRNIVLSRRELIEQQRNEKRKKLFAELQPGMVVHGQVKNITDFGAFIDLDGLDGLLHITDMSWGRINHPNEVCKVGDMLEVVVLDVNREKERVSLGLKQRTPDPWDSIENKYPVGMKVKGKVVNIVPYGAFVELEEGVEGLVHVSELSWTKRIARPSDVLAVGDVVEAVVLQISRDDKKISLGIRQLEPNPWSKVAEKYKTGTHVSGVVRNLTSYGAFVEIEEGIDGMVHVSDMSWTRKINHPSELLKKGDKVDAVVLEVDGSQQRISLGLKQLGEDPWKVIAQKYRVGDIVEGKVTKLASFGAFIQLQDDIDGLVHISQVSEEHVEKIKSVLKVGDPVRARVIKIDGNERRIGLSIKAANYNAEQLEAAREEFDKLKPGEDMVGLGEAFEEAEKKQEEEKKDEGKK